MLFNSIDFAIFLPVVFLLYWFVFHRDLKWQNTFVVVVSYVFYGWWDYRFLSLLFISTMIDYLVAKALMNSIKTNQRKNLLTLSLVANLGILGFFKYYHFFVDGITDAFTFFGFSVSGASWHIILPVGISFYTFQSMSYTIDVYRRKMTATDDFMAFAAYVSFFPQLVAGPIERANHLLPQFMAHRSFDYGLAVKGCRQILWGLFKKIVIADNCAMLADQIFDNHTLYPGSTLFLGAVFFSFQIYGDFSGYSDIAIGTSGLFGFDLRKNFAFPYFSRDVAEFWRRWHISLSTWFRDYVYIPLGGNHGNKWRKTRNILLVFIISGFWHGANLTFIVWGALNALLFLPLMLAGKNRQNLNIIAFDRYLPNLKETFQMVFTFLSVTLLWILFRSESLSKAQEILSEIFSLSFFVVPAFDRIGLVASTIILILFFMIVEWTGRTHLFAIEYLFSGRNKVIRWGFYSLLIALTGVFMQTGGSPFIYFQF